MSCISEILKLKGDKEYLMISESCMAEDGGIYKDYEYLITFNDRGFRCGYVTINNDHKVYNYNDYDSLDLYVHGGVTFFDKSDFILEPSLIKTSCVDKWIGFDADHAYDGRNLELAKKYFNISDVDNTDGYRFLLNSIRTLQQVRSQVRSKEYMIEQCKELIDQLVELNNE
jgi:hypothetical protein